MRHIFEKRILPTSCARRSFHAQNDLKTNTFGGAFPSCAVQEIVVFADWAENAPSWEALFNITCIVACLLGQIFIFSLWLLLLFLFPAQLITIKKSTIPSPILHCMFSFAHLQLCAETKIEGRRCCPPQRAFNNITIHISNLNTQHYKHTSTTMHDLT